MTRGGYGLGVISEMFLFYLFAQSSQAERIDPPKILRIPVLIPRGKSRCSFPLSKQHVKLLGIFISSTVRMEIIALLLYTDYRKREDSSHQNFTR